MVQWLCGSRSSGCAGHLGDSSVPPPPESFRSETNKILNRPCDTSNESLYFYYQISLRFRSFEVPFKIEDLREWSFAGKPPWDSIFEIENIYVLFTLSTTKWTNPSPVTMNSSMNSSLNLRHLTFINISWVIIHDLLEWFMQFNISSFSSQKGLCTLQAHFVSNVLETEVDNKSGEAKSSWLIHGVTFTFSPTVC